MAREPAASKPQERTANNGMLTFFHTEIASAVLCDLLQMMNETTSQTVSEIAGIVNSERNMQESEDKQKKSSRLTKFEKEKLELDKSVIKIQTSGQPYYLLVDRLDRWLQRNHSRAVQILTQFSPKEKQVTYNQFKAAMHDLSIPFTMLELHLLCKLLDVEKNETIDVDRLSHGLRSIRHHESPFKMKDLNPLLRLSNEKYARCLKRGCEVSRWNGETYRIMIPRYLLINFRLASFDQSIHHVGHFSDIISTQTLVKHLTRIITDRTSIALTQASIFREKSCNPCSMLLPDHTLAECGYEGGSKENPSELVLYYTYSLNLRECSLLLCDHYLSRRQRNSKTQAH